MDYAFVSLLGRAVGDATVYKDVGKPTKAILDVATNLPIKKDGVSANKAIFHRVVVWGFHADYLLSCQDGDPSGLKGRLINIFGNIDSESYLDDNGRKITRNIIRVGFPNGNITVMDRRTNSTSIEDSKHES